MQKDTDNLTEFYAFGICGKDAHKHVGDINLQVSISSTFYAHLFCQYFFAKKLQSQNVTREKPRKALLYEKFEHKIMMKLTPGIIFH